MARTATGSAFESRGKFYVVVTVRGTGRVAKQMPSARDLAHAKHRAGQAAELVAMLLAAGHPEHVERAVEQMAKAPDAAQVDRVSKFVRAVAAGEWSNKPQPILPGTTYREVREMLTEGKLHERYPDVVDPISDVHAKDIERKAQRYIEKQIGDFPVSTITLDHALEVMRRLPSTLSQSSRRHVAWNMRRVLELSVFPLRLIATNPIPSTFMPRPGKPKARGFIFPDEDAANIAHQATPLWRRVLWAFLTREGMRKDEAALLQWSDRRTRDAGGWVDAERGWVYLDEHKTEEHSGAREWPLAPDVAEALRRWKKQQPKAARYVFGPGDWSEQMNSEHLADVLRADLHAAGVRRPELFETTDRRRQMNVHDLRGTFVTLALAQGRSEDWIQRRTGHTTSAMLRRYRRNAANLAEGQGAALVSMLTIPELESSAPIVSNGGAASGKAAITSAQSSNADPGNSSVGVPAFLSVEDMGIEPTASRVRFPSTEPCATPTAGEQGAGPGRSGPMRSDADASLTTPRTLLDDLAALVARAVASGDLALARALLDAQAASRPVERAEVVDLAARKARRR